VRAEKAMRDHLQNSTAFLKETLERSFLSLPQRRMSMIHVINKIERPAGEIIRKIQIRSGRRRIMRLLAQWEA
jgi:hypothetical protein